MIDASTSRFGSFRSLAGGLALVGLLGGCTGLATKRDVDRVAQKQAALDKKLAASRAELQDIKSQVDATEKRLDNALRANADRGAEALGTEEKLNDMRGKLDEFAHRMDAAETKMAAVEHELTNFDDTRGAGAAPLAAVPGDKASHFAALTKAHDSEKWSDVHHLGREYIKRYPQEENVDDATYLLGYASLREGRPSSALAAFNRILKTSPKSNVLDRTLLAMGEAYLLLRDCESAKLALKSCVKRFAKTPIGKQAADKLKSIEADPKACAP